MNEMNTVYVDPPGSYLREEIEARGWSQRDLAYILGAPEQAVNMIISGKRGISPDMAKALGDAFDVPAELFLNLQKAYDLSRAQNPSPDVAKRARLQSVYPIREMINRGWIDDTDASLLEAQVARFFEVSDVNNVPHLPHAAKKSNYNNISPDQLAWLFRVKQIAKEMIVDEYSESKLRSSLEHMALLLSEPEEVRHVPRILAESGVRYVLVEKLPKSKIDGACFWLSSSEPVIGMTLRFDRIDNFWFVLRHEIEHVLQKHGQDGVAMIDENLEGDKATDSEGLPYYERVANAASANFCVPKEDFDSFYLRKAPYISERDILGFSSRIGRHPGLVVGQVHNRTNKYNFLRKHLKNVRKHILLSATVDGWGEIAPVDL